MPCEHASGAEECYAAECGSTLQMSVAKGTLLAPLHAFSVNEGQKFQLLPEPMYCAVSREFRQNSTPSMLRARALPTGIYAILQWGGRKKIVFVSKQAPQPPSNS